MPHYLTESNIFLFLIQIALLLGFARALGEVFRKWGQPSITAEILVGIFFGPTILGRLFPDIQQAIFPVDVTQQNMLESVAWLGILFFLLKSGLETNFATAWRLRGKAALLSLSDLSIPMLVAFFPSLYLSRFYMGSGGNAIAFSLFIATIMTISALPVTARILQDLKVYRTDLGLLTMSALTINDVVGWIIFALILGFFTGTAMTIWSIVFILGATLAFAALALSIGSRLFDRVVTFLDQKKVPEPSGSLTLVCIIGLACGALTTWIGIHALFGFFIAGILAGESKLLSEHSRHIFSEMVHAILVPLFFASIGLRLDFLGEFNIPLVLFILLIGLAGRFAAAYIGSRAIRQPPVHSRFIALAHIPGGEMQIVIGMVALEYQVITVEVYVAIVFGAIVTAMLAGPLMTKVLQALQKYDWLTYLSLENVLVDLEAGDKIEAIKELSFKAGKYSGALSSPQIAEAVLHREEDMTTALDEGVAIPHARLDILARPFVILARSVKGIDWDASDGKPVHLIFYVLTQKNDPASQFQILRGISKTVANVKARKALLESKDAPEAMAALRKASINGS